MFDRATIARIAGKVLQGYERAARWNDQIGRKNQRDSLEATKTSHEKAHFQKKGNSNISKTEKDKKTRSVLAMPGNKVRI